MFERGGLKGRRDRGFSEEVSTMAVTVTGAARIQEPIESTSLATG